jgi:hypothetical protein
LAEILEAMINARWHEPNIACSQCVLFSGHAKARTTMLHQVQLVLGMGLLHVPS